MQPCQLKVLNKLREKKRKGVSFMDFPVGTELRKRLCELRDMGYKMTWVWEPQSNGGKHKVWFLTAEPGNNDRQPAPRNSQSNPAGNHSSRMHPRRVRVDVLEAGVCGSKRVNVGSSWAR